MFLWYDRENDNFVELETSHDAVNSTVSVETNHTGENLLVDAEKWFENWEKIKKDTNWEEKRNTTVTVYITKCDDKNDPKFLDPDRDNSVFKHYSNNRKMVFKHLLTLMSDSDRIGFSCINDNGEWISTTYSRKSHYDITKGVNIDYSITKIDNDNGAEIVYAADDLMTFCYDYNLRIVYFTDRDIKVEQSCFGKEYYKNYLSVPVFFICTGNFDKTNLQKIADETGGAVFDLESIDDLDLAFNNYDENPLEKLFTDMDKILVDPGFEDTDGDGFSDIEEEYGIVTSGGIKIQTNPKSKHSDIDGLADNEEIDVDQSAEEVIIKGKKVLKRYHHMRSDPTKQDSDGDGAVDARDKDPLIYNSILYNRTKAQEYASMYYKKNNKDYPYLGDDEDCANFVSQCLFAGGMHMNANWRIRESNLFNRFVNPSVTEHDNGKYRYTFSWALATEQFEYIQRTVAIETIRIKPDAIIEDVIEENPSIHVGDLVYFHNKNKLGFTVTHSTIITKIDKHNIYFSAHSDSYFDRPLSMAIETLDSNNEYLYDKIFIVRISDSLDTVPL